MPGKLRIIKIIIPTEFPQPTAGDSALAAAIPAVEGLHGGFVPGSVRGVGGAAVAVGADLPPVDAGEPGLFVEGGEEGVVTLGLNFEIDRAGRVIPGSAVGFGDTGEAGFGEEDGFSEARLHGGNFFDDGGGREVVGERIVFVDADVVEGVPEFYRFEFGAEVGGVGERPGINFAGAGDELAPGLLVAGHFFEFDADAEDVRVNRGGELRVVLEEWLYCANHSEFSA